MSKANELSKIVVIITGGLIAENSNQLIDINCREIMELIDPNIDSETLELVEFSFIDSSTINLDFLYSLAKFVQRKVNNQYVKGIIILHGTDTLEITAYFLHRCIYSHNKPIILTGSMRMVSNSDYDGKANLVNSIKQVLNEDCVNYASGVTVNFGGKIHSPVYIQKDHSFAIGMMHINRIVWLNKSTKSTIIPLSNKLESIPIIYAFPGATENLLDGYLNNFKGIVVVGYGSGNVSNPMYNAIKKAIDSKLKVVLVTNCKFGGINPEYADIGGNQSLKELGVIMAQDLNAYQAMVVASLVFDNEMIPSGSNLENYFSNKILIN